ncbi:hypothetical protein M8J75_004363 [Diaphorina citri]|nr:hypothetical protein M8J75_004363 [Diaphorina citri]
MTVERWGLSGYQWIGIFSLASDGSCSRDGEIRNGLQDGIRMRSTSGLHVRTIPPVGQLTSAENFETGG